MREPWFGSTLRRLCAPTGAVVALCLFLALPAFASAPSPDPPPLPVAPEPQAAPPPTRAPVVRQAPVVTPAVRSSTPVVATSVQRAKPKPKAAPVKLARVKPKAPAPTLATRPLHDRSAVPLAAIVPSVDSFDRDLLALAGFGLLLVALGGAVVLEVGRRVLREGLA